MHTIAQILDIVVMITAYAIVCIGLWFVWSWFIIEVLIKHCIIQFKFWTIFVQWIYYRKEFKQWVKKQKCD